MRLFHSVVVAEDHVAVLLAVNVGVVVAVSLIALKLKFSKREELERLCLCRDVLESDSPDLCGIRVVYEYLGGSNNAVALARDDRVSETVGTAVVLNGSLAGIPAGVKGLAAVHILYVEIAISVADYRASALALCVDVGLRAHAVSANAAAEVIDTAENS